MLWLASGSTFHGTHLLMIALPNPWVQQVNLFELERDKNFGVSMFERLARRGLPCVQLHTQRRMLPAISCYTKHLYEQDIVDHRFAGPLGRKQAVVVVA